MSLISTADLRAWMSLEEGDKKPNPRLASISQAVEDFVDSFTNRKLEAQVYRTDPYFSYLDGTGASFLYFPQYPVSYVSEVNVDSNRTFGSATVVSSNDYIWYPNGKLSMAGNSGFIGRFWIGRRNIRLDYTAGYAPVVGGTYNSSVSTYPLPNDLHQVMIEMCVESYKEGVTAVHTVQSQQGDPMFTQMLSKNSFWLNVLNKYKAFDASLGDRDE